MIETWLDVVGYEGLYSVSSHGRVFGIKSGKIRKTGKTERGYSCVVVIKNGKYRNLFIHRLVAEAFIGVSEKQVNHKDGNKDNNNSGNLEFVTQSENQIHALANGLRRYKYSQEVFEEVSRLKSLRYPQKKLLD